MTERKAGFESFEVAAFLPHRYPFLLLDKIIHCEPGKRIIGIKNVSRDEALLTSKERTLPHLLVVEALAQISVILTFRTLGLEPSGEELMFFAGIDHAEFGAVPMPGEQIELVSQVVRVKRGVGRYVGEASIGNRSVCTASMLAAWRSA